MGKRLPKTRFIKSTLKEVNFSGADLAGCKFDECDLEDALFDRCNLTGADFSTALKFIINPEINTLKKAVFSHDGLPGLLSQYGIKIV